MSFIAKSPLEMAELDSTPTKLLPGTRALFATPEGWKDVDENGEVRNIAYKEELNKHAGSGEVHIVEKVIEYGSESELDELDSGVYKITHYTYQVDYPSKYYLIVTRGAGHFNALKNLKQTKISNSGIETRMWDSEITDSEGIITGGWTEWANVSSGGEDMAIDSELDSESTNPIQNKIIANKLNSLKYYGDMNIVPTDSNLFEYDGFNENDLSVEIYGFSETNDIEKLVIPYEYKKDEITYRVSLIAPNAFENNTFLKTVVFPSNLDTVADYAFGGCTNLEKAVFSKGNKGIWDAAFSNCTKLKTITLPNTITEIYEKAFDGSGLTDIYYEGTKEQWESIYISEENETLLNATIHFNWMATDVYATKEEVETRVKVWTKGNEYSAGDLVLAQIQTEGKEKFFTVILQCIKDHTAPTDYMIPTLDELFSERWNYNEDFSLHSKYDSEGNVIIEHYATKEEVTTQIGDIETSLENIINKYGLGGEAI